MLKNCAFQNQVALFIFASFMMSLAQASDVSCLLTENASDQNYESSFAIPLDEKEEGQHQINQSAGRLTSANLLVKNLRSIWTLTDPSTGYPLTAFFSAKEGASNRIQVLPNANNNDYFMLDCGRGVERPPQKTPKALTCVLIEKTKNQTFEQTFKAPVATSGHDVYALPEAKIAPLGGWVLAYNGMIAAFLQNKNTFTGVTVLGSWDDEVGVRWHPSSDGTQVTLICQPQ